MVKCVCYNNRILTRKNFIRVFGIFVAYILLFIGSNDFCFAHNVSNPANFKRLKEILIIDSLDVNDNFNDNSVGLLQNELKKNEQVEVTVIHLDSDKIFDDGHTVERLKDLLTQHSFGYYDLVIAKGNRALQAVYQLGGNVFGAVPLIFYDANVVDRAKFPNSTGIVNNGLAKENTNLILTLFPKIQYIAVITDNSYQGRMTREIIKATLNNDNRVSGIYINGDELNDSQIIKKINSLPKKSAIFLDSWSVGPEGRYKNDQLLYEILSNSNFPVFTNKKNIIEQGALGGVVQNLNYINEIISNSIVPDIIEGKRKASEIRISLQNNITALNWLVMARHNVEYKSLDNAVLYYYKPDTVGEIGSSSKITIIYKIAPPLTWKDSYGVLQGVLPAIWRLWGEKNNTSIDFIEQSKVAKTVNTKLGGAQVLIGESEIIKSYDDYYGLMKINPLLITSASIYQNSNLAFEYDWKGYRGKRVAIEKNDSFREFLTEKIPNVNIVVYDDKNTILQELDSGNYDAFFMEDMVAETLLKDVGVKQSVVRNKYCSSKIKIVPKILDGNDNNIDTMKKRIEINEGLNKISYETLYSLIEMNNKTSVNIYPLFSPSEIYWLKNNSSVVLGCADNFGVIQNWSNNNVIGIGPDLLRSIIDNIGIDLRFVKLSNSSNEFDVLMSNEVNALSISSQKEDHNIVYSVAYFKQPVMVLSKNQDHFIGDGSSIVVVPSCYMSFYYYLKKKYHGNMIILASSPTQSVELIHKGIADIAVLDKANAEDLHLDPRYSELYLNVLHDTILSFSVAAIDNYQNKTFLGIINKGIITIPNSVINSYIEKYSGRKNSGITFYEFLTLIGPWVLGLIVIILGLWGVTARKALRKLHISEESLKKEKAWLNATMHSIGEAVIATDVDGRVVQMNFVAEELVQCEEFYAKGLITSELYNLYNSVEKKFIDDPVAVVLKELRVVELKQDIVLVNNVKFEIPIQVTAAPITDISNNKILGTVLVFKDIRAEDAYRNQINQAKAILSNAIELAGVSYFAYDLKTHKVIINSGKQETHLYIDGDLNLEDVLQNIIEQDLIKIQKLWNSVLSREITHFRSNYKSKYKGRIRYNRIDVRSKVERHQLVSAFGVKLDVTDIVMAENVSRERLQQAYDLAKLLYYEYQPITDIVTINEQLSELFMLDELDLKVISLRKMFVNVIEDDKDRLRNYIAQIVNIKLEKFELELRIVKRNRSKIVKLFVSNKFSEDGEWIGSTGCVLDITELNYVQKELETSEEQKRLILGSIKEAVVYISNDLNIVWANESTYKIFGCDKIVALSEEFNFIIYSESQPSMLCNTVSVMRGISDELVETMNYKGKELLVSLNPIRDEEGRVTHLVKTFSDVSEFKEIQKNLKEAYERAESANKAKSAFLSTMTHEIRTPLNAIIGFSGLLQYERLNIKSASYANSIHTAATGLLSLINNVLDLSRLEANKMTLNLSPVNLKELLDEMNIIFEVKAKSKGLNLEFEPFESIPVLILDKDRLRQVLINIIGNAIKFTNEGHVSVRIKYKKYIKKQAGVLHISIIDSGIGIPIDDQARMFESFEQHENSSTRRYEGTGLGLGISKRLVELMNGDIVLNSEVGIGSEFIVILRDVKYTDAVAQNAGSTDKNIKKYIEGRVLLVSDNQSDLTIISSMLDKMGLTIETTSSIIDAIEILNEEKFKLVITSVLGDSSDDFSLNSKLLLSAKSSNMPVIALTGYSDPGEFFDTSQYDTVIIKPVTIEVFSEIIGKFFVRTEEVVSKPNENNIVKNESVDDLSPALIQEVLGKFYKSFDTLSHGIVIGDAQKLAIEFINFANSSNEQLLINIAKNFEQNVATYKLPDIMYIIRQFLKYKD